MRLNLVRRMARLNEQRVSIASREVVGARLRSLRRQNGLTLKELSEACGVPLSTLSKIELGQAALNYDKLMALSLALNVEMSMLLRASDESPGLAGAVFTTATSDHEQYGTETYQHKFLFSETAGKVMTPMLVTIYSRRVDEFRDFVRHPGQEFVYVLSGSIAIVFENDKTIELAETEAAYFDSSVGHVYLATSAQPAHVLAVCTDLG